MTRGILRLQRHPSGRAGRDIGDNLQVCIGVVPASCRRQASFYRICRICASTSLPGTICHTNTTHKILIGRRLIKIRLRGQIYADFNSRSQTRSLASLLVFRAYVSWRNKQATKGGDKVHSVLALEEPESHLHPQAQRSLFAHIKAIPGQRIVSTHSPYFAGQAQLEDLRLFIKSGGDTIVTRLDLSSLMDPGDVRKLQETVIDTRGDLLFSRGLVLFEGQTEEQALPIWAQKYWGGSIHELGFCFVRANGTDYFPFVWLANALRIPWYVFADGEDVPVKNLDAALKKAGEPDSAHCNNVVVHPAGKNFESQLIDEGYMAEIELSLNAMSGSKAYLDEYIAELHGAKGKKGVPRDYTSVGGRERAAFDAMSAAKTSLSKHLSHVITSLPDPERRFPKKIKALFEIISAAHGLKKDKD